MIKKTAVFVVGFLVVFGYLNWWSIPEPPPTLQPPPYNGFIFYPSGIIDRGFLRWVSTGTGARMRIVLQTSKDGVNWVDLDKDFDKSIQHGTDVH